MQYNKFEEGKMKKIISLFAVLMLMVIATTGYAQVRAGSVNITPTIGMYAFEGNEDMNKMLPTGGLRLGYNINKYIGIEGYAQYGQTEVNSWVGTPKVGVFNYGIEGIFNLLPNGKLVPFLAIGVGGVSYSGVDFDKNAYEMTTDSKKDKLTADYGYGVKYFLSDAFALRFDIRHVMPFDKMHSNMLISLGLNMAFGGAKPAPVYSAPAPEPEPVMEQAKPQAEAAPVVEEKPIETAAPVAVVEEVKPQPQTRVAQEIAEKGRATLEVLFDTNKATIKKNYAKDVDHLADVMKQNPDLNVTIEGHTDNVGKAAYNKKLSQKRADAVKKYMVTKGGIDAKRLKAVGYGLEKPVASNKTKAGRTKNRRVEAAVDYIIKK
jgi:OmpA-OmpF porin, OOP family